MKLISYLKDDHEQLGVLVDGFVYDMEVLHPDLPNSMNMFLNYWEDSYPVAQAGELMLKEGTRTSKRRNALRKYSCWLPFPFPPPAAMAMLFASMWQRPGETVKWI